MNTRDTIYEFAQALRTEGRARAFMAHERRLGVELPAEGDVRAPFGDGIITDTTAEKKLDMEGATAGLIADWEYCSKCYGKDEEMPRSRAEGHHAGNEPIPRQPATGRASGAGGGAYAAGAAGVAVRAFFEQGGAIPSRASNGAKTGGLRLALDE